MNDITHFLPLHILNDADLNGMTDSLRMQQRPRTDFGILSNESSQQSYFRLSLISSNQLIIQTDFSAVFPSGFYLNWLAEKCPQLSLSLPTVSGASRYYVVLSHCGFTRCRPSPETDTFLRVANLELSLRGVVPGPNDRSELLVGAVRYTDSGWVVEPTPPTLLALGGFRRIDELAGSLMTTITKTLQASIQILSAYPESAPDHLTDITGLARRILDYLTVHGPNIEGRTDPADLFNTLSTIARLFNQQLSDGQLARKAGLALDQLEISFREGSPGQVWDTNQFQNSWQGLASSRFNRVLPNYELLRAFQQWGLKAFIALGQDCNGRLSALPRPDLSNDNYSPINKW